MRKFFLFGLSAVLSSSLLLAQEGPKPFAGFSFASSPTETIHGALAQETQLVGVNGMNCPVAASAERGGAGTIIQTHSGLATGAQSELHLRFSAMNHPQITEATITLHGTDARPRAELAYQSSAANFTEDFHLTGSANHSLTSASVIPKKLVNVRWVGISELQFADGSTWHQSAQSYCHIQPNGFRLVDAVEQK